MHRTPEEWGKTIPSAVLAGSPAQSLNVLSMAIDDIAELGRMLKSIMEEAENGKAVSEQGYANGLKAASIMLDKMADAHTRVVGTNTVREVAAALREKAAELRRSSSEQIAALEAAHK